MRIYGRFMKNIAAFALLLALLALLLPFCRFQAAGQDVTLSGVDVLAAGGSAAYTYIQKGSVLDDHIMKAPFTWGDVKEGLHYADDAGASNLLIAGGVAAVLPVLLCFLAMCMLFLAEGHKTMLLPTLFVLVNLLEFAVVFVGLTALHPYLLMGVGLFAMLHIAAFFFIFVGWLTGGYREPEKKERRRREDSGDDDRSGRRKHRRRKGRRKKSNRKKGKKNKDDKKNKDKKDNSREDNNKQDPPKAAAGNICDGTGIYQGISWNLKENASSRVMLGTTPEAVRGIETGSLKAAGHIADHNCQIRYHAGDQSYTVVSHAAERVLLRQNGKVLRPLKKGDSVRILGQTNLEVEGAGSIWLK